MAHRIASSATGRAPRCTLVGMLHLPALPGAPAARRDMEQIYLDVIRDARLLAEAGFDALMIENYGDHPFHAESVPAETIAAMAILVHGVAQLAGKPVGVNVLRNDAQAALAIAAAAGASFIRVNVHSGVMATDQGLITGRAAETIRMRQRLRSTVKIFADVHVKHASPVSQHDLALAAHDTAYRGMADGLIVSGQATGAATDLADVRRVKQAVPDRPVWVGSGVTPENAPALAAAADGLIIGTCLKRGGRTDGPLDPARIRTLMAALGRGRRSKR